jgi:membrane associated rhomboid family serine protease
MIGASGAISAVMGAYLVMFPHSRVKMLFIVFTFRVSAWLFLGLWIIQQWVLATTELESKTASGVALWAHIGGFAMGIASGFIFRSKGYMNAIELEIE